MSEEERLQLEQECLLKYSKVQMIQKYIDELEENYKLKEKQNYDLKWALKYDELYKENQELKNQLSSKTLHLENQQKEFIEYLMNLMNLSNWYSADGVRQGIANEILSKYKKIIGDDK